MRDLPRRSITGASTATRGHDVSPSIGESRRRLGLRDTFVLQFSLICVLGSIFGNFTWGITTSGPGFIWPWVVGGALQVSVALSIAELSSAYPIAGACYSWLRRLSSNSLAWFTGFLLLFGYIAALADDDTGVASSALAFAGVTSPTEVAVVAIALICLCAQTVLCIFSIRVSARGTAIAVAVQFVGIAGVVVILTILGLRQHPALLLNSHGMTEHEHMPRFLLMLLIPAWTLTGFDAPGNLAEEMKDPRRTGPRGLMAATIAAFICGTALIAIPLLAMTVLGKTVGASSSFLYILQTRLGAGPAVFINAIAVTALLFQPVVLLLVAGRLLWAQARDDAWPAADWLFRLNRRGAPARATVVCAIVAAAFCMGWPILSPLGTVWPALLMLAYGITIAVGLSAKMQRRLPRERGWSLGVWGMVNDGLAVLWSVFIAVLLLLFDAFHAVPMFLVVVGAGALTYVLWIKPRWSPLRVAT